jgi:hypothetical protein
VQGATAAGEGIAPIGAAQGGDGTAGRIRTRRLVAMAVCVVIVFGVAFAIGSMTKKHSAPPTPPGQLATGSAASTKQIAITPLGASSAVPDLKPKPAPPKPKPKQSTVTTVQSTPSTTFSAPPVTSTPQVVNPAPVTHPTPAPAPSNNGGGSSGGGGGSSSGGG